MRVKKRFILTSVSICIFTLVVHAGYVFNGFTWLDHIDIELGSTVYPLQSIGNMFVSPLGSTGFFRPIVTLLHSIDFALYGLWSPGYHITNIMLHCIVSVIAPLAIARFIHLSWKERVVLGSIVAVHPVGILPVASVSYRSELLLLLFLLATVLLYGHKQRRIRLLSYVFALLSVLSKETAFVVLPFLLLAMEVGVYRQRWTRALRRLAPFLIGIFVMFMWRLAVVSQVWHVPDIPLSLLDRMSLSGVLLGELIFDLASPFVPTLSDAVHVSLSGIYILLLLSMVSVLVLTRHQVDRSLKLMYILLLISLMPAAGLVPVARLGSPHYGYIVVPFIVAFVIVGFRHIAKSAAIVVSAVLLIWLSIATVSTVQAGRQYVDDISLFGPEVEKDQAFSEGWYYLGNAYQDRDDHIRAADAYDHALKSHPGVLRFQDTTTIRINYASSLMQLGRLDDAYQMLEDARARAAPEVARQIRYNQALISFAQKEYDHVIMLVEDDLPHWQISAPHELVREARKRLEDQSSQNEM